MNTQDLLVPKGGPSTGPNAVAETPAADEAPKSPGAFASAMRQALNRSCGGRSADEPRRRIQEKMRKGGSEVQSPNSEFERPKSDVGARAQDSGLVLASPPMDPALAAAI